MRTNSYISVAALAAALIATPQPTWAQDLGVSLGGTGVEASVDLGGETVVDVDAEVDVGSESGLNVDAVVDVGGSSSDSNVVDVDVGAGTGSDADTSGSLVDVDLDVGTVTNTSGSTGPNGGALIDLNANVGGEAGLNTDVKVLSGGTAPATSTPSGTNLITGAIRIGALGTSSARADALFELISSPNLANIDLDAAIDDTRVSIIAAADLLSEDAIADVEVAIRAGGDGRAELLKALSDSTELSSILGNQGIDLEEVLAVQIAENGATEVIVLDGTVRVVLGGNDGEVASVSLRDAAELDVDLLADDELAAVDLNLLPEDQRAEVQLRLLSGAGDLADLSVEQLAGIDLDLLSDEQLASLDVQLLPETLRTPIELRLLGEEGQLADLTVGQIAELKLGTQPAGSASGFGTDTETDTDEDAAGSGARNEVSNGGGTPGNAPLSSNGNSADGGVSSVPSQGASGSSGSTTGGRANGALAAGVSTGGNGSPNSINTASTSSAAQPNNSFGIASLECDIGVLALAHGMNATAQTIADAQSLELVRIEGCERILVDAEVDAIHAAVQANPAIASVLKKANIPIEHVIGATIQAGTLTLFIETVLS
jgi:hypothetical protein